MDEALTEFVNKRINTNYYKLRNDEQWKEANTEYNLKYDKFYNNLSKEQQEELDKIIDLKNTLMEYESNFGYKVAIIDILKLFLL